MISVAPGLASADLGGEAVVLDPKAGQYFGLNEVAARIFELVQKPKTFVDVEEALLREYDVDREQLRRDIGAFVDALVARGLVEVT